VSGDLRWCEDCQDHHHPDRYRTKAAVYADLLIECDSLLSLILHRERMGLSEQTIRDLNALLARLRPRTDSIIALGEPDA